MSEITISQKQTAKAIYEKVNNEAEKLTERYNNMYVEISELKKAIEELERQRKFWANAAGISFVEKADRFKTGVQPRLANYCYEILKNNKKMTTKELAEILIEKNISQGKLSSLVVNLPAKLQKDPRFVRISPEKKWDLAERYPAE